MAEYTLKVNEATGKVRYLMKQNGANVTGETSVQSAMWMLKRGEVERTDEFEGYPLTADGVYFFEGTGNGEQGTGEAGGATPPLQDAVVVDGMKIGVDGGALSPACAGTSPSADGEARDTAEDGVEIGADGAPIPAGDGGKRRRKKRIKDEVCQ